MWRFIRLPAAPGRKNAQHLSMVFARLKATKTLKMAFQSQISGFSAGAVNAIRTHDLILTKDVLCRLSYNSKWRRMGLELHDL